MTKSQTCTRCGTELSGTGNLKGLCPRCLLGEGPEVVFTQARGGLGTDAGTAAGTATGAAAGAEVDRDRVQALFPEFEILDLLGRGGMGVVFKARQLHLDRMVALKLLAPELAADPTFASRFVREARALARLSHQNIVGVYDFGEKQGSYYLVMEFVNGASLRQVMERGAMTTTEALLVVPQICEALQFAHELGIVHRDIKPENILLDQQGRVKIADFGLAKLLDHEPQHLTRTHQVMGTPHYMAPEQVNTPLEVDHRADIYSLGVVFYEMLTRELPVGRFPKPSEKVRLDKRLDNVVIKTLEREPDRRYQQASEVKTAVEHASGTDHGADGVPSPAPDTSLGWISSFPEGPLGVAWLGLLLAGVCFGFLAIRHSILDNEWLAISYPLCFLGFVAMRSPLPGESEESKTAMRIFCFLCSGFTLMCLSSEKWDLDQIAMQVVASILLLLAHLLLDRWVWGYGIQVFVAAVPLFILAVILNASAYEGERHAAINYASGMLSLLAAASVLPLLPEFSRDNYPPWISRAVLRCLCLGIPAAAVFFRGFIF